MEHDDYDDPLFDNAVSFVIEQQNASVGRVQRQFRIGYLRASNLIERMTRVGLVSQPDHEGNRAVIFSDLDTWIEHAKDMLEPSDDVDLSNVIPWPGKKNK